MRDNINKVSQRGERLDALQDKTDNLAVSAQGFRRGANRVRKQMWWKVCGSRCCCALATQLANRVLGYENAHVHHYRRYNSHPHHCHPE